MNDELRILSGIADGFTKVRETETYIRYDKGDISMYFFPDKNEWCISKVEVWLPGVYRSAEEALKMLYLKQGR